MCMCAGFGGWGWGMSGWEGGGSSHNGRWMSNCEDKLHASIMQVMFPSCSQPMATRLDGSVWRTLSKG